MNPTVPDRIADLSFAAIDFESAGAVRGATDVPVQIGVAVANATGGIDLAGSFGSFLASDQPVHWSARKVHGISDADLVGAPTLLGVWPETRQRLRNRWIVAHGAGTERKFLKAFPGHGFGPWVDTLQIYRHILPHAETHSLSYLCRQCGLEGECLRLMPDFRWHDALSDAVACLLLLQHWIRSANLHEHPPELLLNPSGR